MATKGRSRKGTFKRGSRTRAAKMAGKKGGRKSRPKRK